MTAVENDWAWSSVIGEGGQFTAVGLVGQTSLSKSRAPGAVRQSQPRGISGKWQLIAKAKRFPTENAVVCMVGARSSSEIVSGSLSAFTIGKLALTHCVGFSCRG